MKKTFTLIALLFAVAFSSCSKDDDANFPTLTTQDFISLYGMTESELDAKFSGYRKTELTSGVSYGCVDELYVSAYNSDENFLSITLGNGVATDVSLLHKKYPTTFYNAVVEDLTEIYTAITPTESSYSGTYTTTFKTGELKITVFRSTTLDTATLQIEAQ